MLGAAFVSLENQDQTNDMLDKHLMSGTLYSLIGKCGSSKGGIKFHYEGKDYISYAEAATEPRNLKWEN